MRKIFRKIPTYLWSFISLVLGLIIGASFGNHLKIISLGVHSVLTVFIKIVPVLIFLALSPAINKLASKGNGGKLAASIIFWYLTTSFFAGLIGLIISSFIFEIKIFSDDGSMLREVYKMFTTLKGDSSKGEFYSVEIPLDIIVLFEFLPI